MQHSEAQSAWCSTPESRVGPSAAAARSSHLLPDSLAVSLGTAAVVAASVLAAAFWMRLPLFAGAAAYLFLAVAYDVRTTRIPNWLNLVALVGATVGAGVLGGVSGLSGAGVGVGLGLAIGFPLFALGLGAGDAKGLMVLGAFFGGSELIGVIAWMLLVGGFVAVLAVTARREWPDLFQRWGCCLTVLVTTRKFVRIQPHPDSVAARGLPFAIPMGLGTAMQLIWGGPWI